MAFDNALAWLAGFEFGSLFVYLIAVLLCLVLGYRVWDKCGRGRPKKTLLDPVDAIEPEPQLNQQPQQEAEVVHEPHETQEPSQSAVPVQLDLLGFSTKQK